ncbi:MAG: pyridoxal phosphate-dependent decarboxylase family protein [Cellvibrionaceae bacterium]
MKNNQKNVPDNQDDAVSRQIRALCEYLTIDHTDEPSVDATTWFLGPKAENRAMFEKQIMQALQANYEAREEYEPDDPHFNGVLAGNSVFEAQTAAIEPPLEKMLRLLKDSIPMPSYRNQSHMNWDLTTPSVVGYIAAMLYNQNNVAPEASPVTTALEILVGQDLCHMLGFKEQVSDEFTSPSTSIVPWGHITCDGSIANGEAMWAARNLTYLPIALAAAIRLEDDMKAARTVTVKTYHKKRVRLLTLSNWELLNLPVDEVLGLVERIETTKLVTPEAIQAAVEKYALQSIGLMAMREQYLDDYNHAKPVICVPKTAHYSWPKGATLIGLGTHSIKFIDVDYDGRMDMRSLRAVLAECLGRQQPVLQVVAVIGSTEEGAVDPLTEIIAIREEFREQGMEFVLHVDGAWGGYFRTMLLDVDTGRFGEDRATDIDEHPGLQLSEHVLQQLHAFPEADSITIDPHKSGFIPYPAGSLCYRNGAMRGLIKFTAPVVFHEPEDKNIGAYGIEGSKPGAAAASVYLSHAVIPLNRLGYGRLLGRCIFNNKRFYAALVAMPEQEDLFTITPLQRLPSERHEKNSNSIEEEIKILREQIVPLENDELFDFFKKDNERSKRALALFKAIGSDLSIIAYAFNFKTRDGINTDVTLMNELNDLIYHTLSFTTIDIDSTDADSRDKTKNKKPSMIVTSSQFDPANYGNDFVDYFASRAGVILDPKKEIPVSFIISTTQNPWLTATSQGNFLSTLMDVLKETVNEAAKTVMKNHNIPLPISTSGKL